MVTGAGCGDMLHHALLAVALGTLLVALCSALGTVPVDKTGDSGQVVAALAVTRLSDTGHYLNI